MDNSKSALLIAGAIVGLHIYLENKKLRYQKKILVDCLADTTKIMIYFGDIIDRNEIELSDFDKIVLMNSFTKR